MKKRYFLLSLFISLIAIAVAGISFALRRKYGLEPSDGATIFAGLIAFAIVWWQGALIQEQMQLSTMLELDREWNSPEMLGKRRAAWNSQNEPDVERIEGVLEFLEKVSTLEKGSVISSDLIWDMFGSDVSRYHYYCKDVIETLRKRWTSGREDVTLYRDLQDLADELLKQDVKKGNVTADRVRKEFEDTKRLFINFETGKRGDP
jgi:hypothetical protein